MTSMHYLPKMNLSFSDSGVRKMGPKVGFIDLSENVHNWIIHGCVKEVRSPSSSTGNWHECPTEPS